MDTSLPKAAAGQIMEILAAPNVIDNIYGILPVCILLSVNID